MQVAVEIGTIVDVVDKDGCVCVSACDAVTSQIEVAIVEGECERIGLVGKINGVNDEIDAC